MAVLFNAGAHVPEIPLFDVVGNAARVAPEQIGATAVKVGVTCGLTVMVKVVVVAHCPALGVKVYVVVAVLLSAGDHIPVIPLFDVVGNAAKVAPEQMGATAVKVGVNTVGIGTQTPPLQFPVGEVLLIVQGNVAALNVLTNDQVDEPSCCLKINIGVEFGI